MNQINSERLGPNEAMATIARIQAGEKELFHSLVRPVERAVFLMLFMLLHNETDAEDAAQETFIKIYRNLHAFRGDAKFSTWVLSIARNEGLALLRKRSRHPEEPLEVASRRMSRGASLSPILRDASLQDAPQDEGCALGL